MDFLKKPLYKKRDNKKLEGVCAGLAESLDVDVSWIRLAFALSAFLCSAGIIVYIVLAIVLDFEDNDKREKYIDYEKNKG